MPPTAEPPLRPAGAARGTGIAGAAGPVRAAVDGRTAGGTGIAGAAPAVSGEGGASAAAAQVTERSRRSAGTAGSRPVSRTRPAAGGGMRRRTGVAVVTGLAVVAAVLLCAGPAQATGYRYWSYWLRSGGAWTYAQTGPAMHVPHDGDVEGWRFGVSQAAGTGGARPRGAADFAAICGTTPAAHGMKRIALVIDPGTPADAPGGVTPPAQRTLCARIDSGASSADALAAVARPLRYDSAGILCAISGYPQAGCGDQVASSSGSGTSATSPASAASSPASGHKGGGPSVGIYAGLAAVLALAAAAAWQTRRRRR